jgi:hypothetical protein
MVKIPYRVEKKRQRRKTEDHIEKKVQKKRRREADIMKNVN